MVLQSPSNLKLSWSPLKRPETLKTLKKSRGIPWNTSLQTLWNPPKASKLLLNWSKNLLNSFNAFEWPKKVWNPWNVPETQVNSIEISLKAPGTPWDCPKYPKKMLQRHSCVDPSTETLSTPELEWRKTQPIPRNSSFSNWLCWLEASVVCEMGPREFPGRFRVSLHHCEHSSVHVQHQSLMQASYGMS